MLLRVVTNRSFLCANLCLMLAIAAPLYGVAAPPENEISPAVKSSAVPSRTSSKKNRRRSAPPAKQVVADTASGTLYTVKAGDSLFKILRREYGLTEKQAAKFLDVVRRENKISDFRRLRIGQKITITALYQKAPAGVANNVRIPGDSTTAAAKPLDQAPPTGQMFSLEKPEVPSMRGSDFSSNVKQAWGKIVPDKDTPQKMGSVNSDGISISLDPEKYPILTAMDGGRILVDADGKISPAVKSVLSETEPGLRVVSQSTDDPKRFLGSLIEAGKFYSTAEDFAMEFGSDPKITVRSDFRIEKTVDSLVNQDVILMNAGKVAFPSKVTEFLKNEGFTVHEPFALIKPHVYTPRNRMVQIDTHSPLDTAGSILKALSIPAESNARIDISDNDKSGVSISITPDRYFRYKGKSYCLNYDNESFANNSLAPVLTAKGINSIVINKNDDFSKISEKILTGIGLSGTYGFQKLWPEEGAGYGLEMSGIMIEGAGPAGESLFLTDREIDRIIRDISTENGIIVQY